MDSQVAMDAKRRIRKILANCRGTSRACGRGSGRLCERTNIKETINGLFTRNSSG